MRITVRVKPNSKKNRIVTVIDNFYNVDIKALPQDGKANLELVRLLSRHFRKKAKIISGKSSKRKIVQLD